MSPKKYVYLKMQKKLTYFIFFNLLFCTFSIYAGNSHKRDSLLIVLKTEKKDTIKLLEAYNGIGETYYTESKNDSAFYFWNMAYEKYSQSYSNQKDTLFIENKSSLLNNLGVAYQVKGNLGQALFFQYECLKLREVFGTPKQIATVLSNIGVLNRMLKNYDKAIAAYIRSYNLLKNTKNNDKIIGYVLSNLGVVNVELKNYSVAKLYFKESIKIRTKIKDSIGLGQSYSNISSLYFETNSLDSSRYFLEIAQTIGSFVKDKSTKVKNLITEAKLLRVSKKYDEAMQRMKEGFDMASASKITELEKRCLEQMYLISISKGDYKNGYELYNQYIELKDSLSNTELQKLGLTKQFESENQLKEIENKKELEKMEALSLEKESKSYIIIGFVSIIIVLLTAFSIFLFSRLKLIGKQRNEIQHKNIEILDSISYAKRIQDAILPPMDYWKTHLPNSFIYYQPKDIVAGDFYWMEPKGDFIFFAAADRTGHGVPGALVSVVCSNALNRTVLEFGILEPGKILDKTRELVISTFEKSGKDVKDGMDISLCCLNINTNELKWSGANNPIWIIQNKKLTEIKGDKQPVGKFSDLKKFTTHTIQLQKDDSIYIFTDGYADQFGGPKGKKYKYKQLQEDVLEIQSFPMETQKNMLAQKFINWKNELEQVDDICIIGIKI